MELKDWLELLIPLIGDGLILFAIHFYVEHRFMKTKAKNEQCVKAITDYQMLIGTACKKLQVLVYEKPNDEIVEILNEVIHLITVDIEAHYQMHSELLAPIETEHKSLNDQIKLIAQSCSGNDLHRLRALIQQLHVMLNHISNQCDKRIYKYL